MKGKQPKQDKKAKKPVKDHEPKSEPPRKSKSTNQAEAETVHKVEMGIEAESELLVSGPLQAMRFTMVT